MLQEALKRGVKIRCKICIQGGDTFQISWYIHWWLSWKHSFPSRHKPYRVKSFL